MNRRLGKALVFGFVIFCLTGCEQVQKVKDMISSPEEIVTDYAVHVAEIMDSTAKCDELSEKLHAYCTSREAVVTEAVTEAMNRYNRNEISKEALDKMVTRISSLKNTNMTSCLLTPSVTIEKVSCLKPLIGLTRID